MGEVSNEATSRRRSSTGSMNFTTDTTSNSSEEGFQKLFASVADSQTKDNHQRHLALTKHVIYENEQGWRLAELPLVDEMLLLLRDKVLDGVPQFEQPLLNAVVLCSKPFVRQKSNEEFSNPLLLTGIIPTLAQLLSFEILEIQIAAAQALKHFATGACLVRPNTNKSRRNSSESGTGDGDLRIPTRVFSQNLMEETGTIDLIVGVFHDLFPDDEVVENNKDSIVPDGIPNAVSLRSNRVSELVIPLMELVYELSSHQRCAEVLVVTGALHYVIFLLHSVRQPQDVLLCLGLMTLVNVLELCEEKMKSISTCSCRRELLIHFRLRNATYFLSNPFTCHTLLQLFEMLLVHGYRKQDKEMRNEILMIFLLLIRRRRSFDLFHQTGITTSLLLYATMSEGRRNEKGSIGANPHHYASNSDEDFEFKQLVWLVLSEISTDHDENLQSMIQFRFLDILLDYATNRQQSQGKGPTYTPVQLEILQSTALSVLINVTPYLVDHIYEINGHVALLDYIQAGRASDMTMKALWQLVMHISCPVLSIQDEMGHNHAIETALTAFHVAPSRHTYGLRRNAIVSCASLCYNHDKNKSRFFQARGVGIITQALHLDSAHVVLEENIMIGILEALRCCIIGHHESELEFVRLDGLVKLLDMVAQPSVPKALKNQLLAAIGEICVNPVAIPSFTSWRSDQTETNNATAIQLLLGIYANEETIEDETNRVNQVVTEELVTREDNTIVSSDNVRGSAFRSVINCKSPFIIFGSTVVDINDGPKSPITRPASPAFARLKEALKASQTPVSRLSHPSPPKMLLDLNDFDFDPQLNLKAKIYSILTNVSLEYMEKLTSRELMMLEIAKEYPTFKIGEMWQNVELTLHAQGIRPIYADALYIRKQIEQAYNIATSTKTAQKEIHTRDKQLDEQNERTFFTTILQQKQQDEQTDAFYRANRRHHSTMQLHLDAKQTRLEFMKIQDPTGYAAREQEMHQHIKDPPPVYEEELNSIAQKEKDLRGRLSTITIPSDVQTKDLN